MPEENKEKYTFSYKVWDPPKQIIKLPVEFYSREEETYGQFFLELPVGFRILKDDKLPRYNILFILVSGYKDKETRKFKVMKRLEIPMKRE